MGKQSLSITRGFEIRFRFSPVLQKWQNFGSGSLSVPKNGVKTAGSSVSVRTDPALQNKVSSSKWSKSKLVSQRQLFSFKQQSWVGSNRNRGTGGFEAIFWNRQRTGTDIFPFLRNRKEPKPYVRTADNRNGRFHGKNARFCNISCSKGRLKLIEKHAKSINSLKKLLQF